MSYFIDLTEAILFRNVLAKIVPTNKVISNHDFLISFEWASDLIRTSNNMVGMLPRCLQIQ